VAAAEAAATNNDEKGGDVRQPHDGGTGPAQQPTGSLQQHLDDTGGRLVHPAKPEELAKPLAAKGVQV
jgi:hypothetical protein